MKVKYFYNDDLFKFNVLELVKYYTIVWQLLVKYYCVLVSSIV